MILNSYSCNRCEERAGKGLRTKQLFRAVLGDKSGFGLGSDKQSVFV